MKKLGIFGGTFNPVHNGHMAVAEAAVSEFGLDRLMFLPNYQPPHKKCEAKPELRLQMVKAAAAGNSKYFVSDFEISKGGISYSVHTLKAFSELYRGEELYFIIGGDSLRDFTKWYKPEEIARYCILLTYPRNDIILEEHINKLRTELGATVCQIHAPEINISSSEIRSLIGSGQSVRDFVPPGVLEIIENNNLYKG